MFDWIDVMALFGVALLIGGFVALLLVFCVWRPERRTPVRLPRDVLNRPILNPPRQGWSRGDVDLDQQTGPPTQWAWPPGRAEVHQVQGVDRDRG